MAVVHKFVAVDRTFVVVGRTFVVVDHRLVVADHKLVVVRSLVDRSLAVVPYKVDFEGFDNFELAALWTNMSLVVQAYNGKLGRVTDDLLDHQSFYRFGPLPEMPVDKIIGDDNPYICISQHKNSPIKPHPNYLNDLCRID